MTDGNLSVLVEKAIENVPDYLREWGPPHSAWYLINFFGIPYFLLGDQEAGIAVIDGAIKSLDDYIGKRPKPVRKGLTERDEYGHPDTNLSQRELRDLKIAYEAREFGYFVRKQIEHDTMMASLDRNTLIKLIQLDPEFVTRTGMEEYFQCLHRAEIRAIDRTFSVNELPDTILYLRTGVQRSIYHPLHILNVEQPALSNEWKEKAKRIWEENGSKEIPPAERLRQCAYALREAKQLGIDALVQYLRKNPLPSA